MVSPRPGYRLWVGLLSLGSSHADLALSVLPPSPLCLALVLSPRRPRFCAPPPTLCLLSPLLCVPCVAGSLPVPPPLCCAPPPCALCLSSLLRVSVSSFYHPCPSSSLLLPPRPLPLSPCLPCLSPPIPGSPLSSSLSPPRISTVPLLLSRDPLSWTRSHQWRLRLQAQGKPCGPKRLPWKVGEGV